MTKAYQLTPNQVVNETEQLSPAVVVLSGGQDSATCLALACRIHKKVYAISFTYEQRHANEIKAAKNIAGKFDNVVEHLVTHVGALADIGNSALISGTNQADINSNHPTKKNLPASFVPNRNAVFLTLAHAYAQKVGALSVYTGVCQTDYSGYPDCRETFVIALERALNFGSEATISIKTPLMHLNKAETFKLAEDYDVLDIILKDTLTCYEGYTTMNEWGKGCGCCPSCTLRANGWDEYLEYDA